MANRFGIGKRFEVVEHASLMKAHAVNELRNVNPATDALLLLHRDMLEASLSWYGGERRLTTLDVIRDIENGVADAGRKNYFRQHRDNGAYYGAYKGTKRWIEYGDLMDNPMEVLRKLEDVIGYDEDRAQDLKANLQLYRGQLIDVKKQPERMRVYTEGHQVDFWRTRLTTMAKAKLESL